MVMHATGFSRDFLGNPGGFLGRFLDFLGILSFVRVFHISQNYEDFLGFFSYFHLESF